MSDSTLIAPQRRLIDGKAAAAKAGCSHRHWLRLVDAGIAPAGVRLGHLRRWDAMSIDSWIAGGCLPIRPDRRAE